VFEQRAHTVETDALIRLAKQVEAQIDGKQSRFEIGPCHPGQHARFDPNTRLPRHYHSGTVHFYTTAGAWGYVEHPEDLQAAGSYLYEPAGSIHTFETKEGAEGIMVVEGANVNLNDDGSLMFIMDAGWIEQALVAAAMASGQKLPRYVKPGSIAYSAK
jgi:quercetin dioxygenase-like cupin family protein